ncbi:YeeE/YedE family protein [Flavobacteriaceae bacterium F08102]|nr:YeeE/YedE family protein [Flavobacteriaceae bacterium F08102]
MDWILAPWPWYVSGPLIAFVMFLLLLVGKNFGMSANFRTLCTLCGANKKARFFDFDWKSQRWNLVVALGAIVGGYIGAHFLSNDNAVILNPDTTEELHTYGFESAGNAYTPNELFDMKAFNTPKTLFILLVSGLLIGFGTRYAGGCTSGHTISGLSNLQIASLIATIGFFIGGLIMIYFIFPLLF